MGLLTRGLIVIFVANTASGLLSSQSAASLIGWPWEPERDVVYKVNVENVNRPCFQACSLGAVEDEEDDEVVVRGADQAEAVSRAFKHRTEDEMIAGMWKCEAKCGVLEPVLVDDFLDVKGKYLVLWESRAFSDMEHSRAGLGELVKIAATIASPHNLFLYTYAGWVPQNPDVLSWWRLEHTGQGKLRHWQPSPGSFGGWGRATLSMVENGHIGWDVFDIVHGSKHWDLLGSADYERSSEFKAYVRTHDLHGALTYVLATSSKKSIPLQTCLQVARLVLTRKQLLSLHQDHSAMHTIDELCEDLEDEKHNDLVDHRSDVSYERFIVMARAMNVVETEESIYDHGIFAWRTVMRHYKSQRVEETSNFPVLVRVSIVPVFDGGVSKGGLGVGDRHEALLLSLCFHNSSVPRDDMHTVKYHTKDGHNEDLINTDIFFSLIPCGVDYNNMKPFEVAKCLKAVIADTHGATYKEDGGQFQIEGFVFGSGFVGKGEYREFERFWSTEEYLYGEGEFPPEAISEKFIHEQQERDKRSSGFHFKDEL
mmetsp:Transcript_19232/g.31569  ORF Transcript_19232/g.31569 Transcript_19232/m.31569 type:complete len:539 (+) Transcript_19232:16-1632(+)